VAFNPHLNIDPHTRSHFPRWEVELPTLECVFRLECGNNLRCQPSHINVHMHILIRKIIFSNQIDTMLSCKNNYNLLKVTNKTKFKTNLWKLKAMVSWTKAFKQVISQQLNVLYSPFRHSLMLTTMEHLGQMSLKIYLFAQKTKAMF